MATCTVGGLAGSVSTMGKNADDVTGMTLINGSSFFCQSTIVPPLALLFWSGSSRSYKSTEFSEEQYSWPKTVLTACRSHWYACGSPKKTREGTLLWSMSDKINAFLLSPSIFHVSAVTRWLGALAEVANLSVQTSLNAPCLHQYLLPQT